MFWSPLAPAADGMPATDEQQLPSGPWLGSLRSVWCSLAILANSVAAPQAAPALQYVCLGDAPEAAIIPSHHWCSFWAWAAAHTSLRRLSLDLEDGERISPEVFDKLLGLRDAHPNLAVHRCKGDVHFTDEVLESLS